jgi:hypothetical protein
MSIPRKRNFTRRGQRFATRSAVPGGRWNLAVSAWLVLVLAIFFWVRIWQSATVTQLLHKVARH